MSNIITVTFNGETRTTVTDTVYQYDYGQQLYFSDIELDEYFEVHFANTNEGKAATVIGHNQYAEVPDQYLLTGQSVFGWVVFHSTEDDGETEYAFRIPVKKRAKAVDEVSPQEQSIIEQAIAALQYALANVDDVVDESIDEYNASITASASTLAEGSSATVSFTNKNFAFGIPKGDTGNGIASVVLNSDYTLTITFTDGTIVTTSSIRGEQGEKGDTGERGLSILHITTTPSNGGSSLYPTAMYIIPLATVLSEAKVDDVFVGDTIESGSYHYPVVAKMGSNVLMERRESIKGDTGNGIASIEKTSTSDLVDTYTITFTNGTTTTFTVTNGEKGDKGDKGDTGNGIESVELTSTSGAVKTYTITFTDETTTTFDVTDGEVTNAVLEDTLKKVLPQDTASGEIAEIVDGTDLLAVKSLSVELEPIQDLNGYDKPWSGGNGKNKLDQSAYTSLDATSYSNGVFTAETLSTFSSAMVRLYKNGAVVGTINKAPTEGSRVSINVTVDDTWDSCFIGYRMGGQNNVGGVFNKPNVADGAYTVSFMADRLPTTSVYGVFSNIQFESGSTATSWAPYSNLCPISGRTECVTEVCGVNLFDEANATIYKRYFQHQGGGVYKWSATGDSTSFALKCLPNTTYTIKSNNPNANIFRVATINVDISESESAILNQVSTASNPRTITTDADATYIVFQINNSIGMAREGLVQIEYGSTATDYEPYQGDTYTTTLGRTVYGGEVEQVGGSLTDRKGYKKYTGISTTSGTAVSAGWRCNFACPTDDINRGKWSVQSAPLFSMLDGSKVLADGGISKGYSANDYTVIVANATSKAEADAILEGLEICYTLATPQTYQLTGQDIELIEGNNYVWSDGEISVEYYADTQLYIDKKTSSLEARIEALEESGN